MNSEDLTIGRAVRAVWGELPATVQHNLFEAAVRISGSTAREPLAALLHNVHPRTAEGEARAVPEPDSLGR